MINQRYCLTLLTLIFLSVFCLGCSKTEKQAKISSENNNKTKTVHIPHDQLFTRIISKIDLKGMSKEICQKPFFQHCYNKMSLKDCNSKMLQLTNECSKQVEANYANQNNDAITCKSKDECGKKGSALGSVVGAEIGSCASPNRPRALSGAVIR